MELKDIQIQKKNGTLEKYEAEKVLNAVEQSAIRARVNKGLTDEESRNFIAMVEANLSTLTNNIVKTEYIHMLCERILAVIAPDVGIAYTNYHSFRMSQAKRWEKIMGRCATILSDNTDKSSMEEKNQNANADSTLASTTANFFGHYTAEDYWFETFPTSAEKQAMADGYIYGHDKNGRSIYPLNCCVPRIDYVLKSGCEINGVPYNEPTTLAKAFDVIGDIILMAASQQYGGFTTPRIDSLLVPYAEKSYQMYLKKYDKLGVVKEKAEEQATEDVKTDMYDGFQGLEIKLNTVASSRGDYPFTTVTFGLDTSKWGKMAAIACLDTRRGGQGKKGHKKPVLFPKLVFLYDKNLHGEGCVNEDVFEAGIACSAKCMYPDWLSLTGEGYVPEMYKKYGTPISPMGCVDGKEIIAYKIGQESFIESFEKMWERVTKENRVYGQRNYTDKNLVAKPKNMSIYDTREKRFVKITHVIRNVDNEWNRVTLSNGKTLLCTTNHPFETENHGIVYAKDLLVGRDKILTNLAEYSADMNTIEDVAIVMSVERVSESDAPQYSYDVTTETAHFEVSGIYSHNCRAFLSPWYERGGMEPADENDKPIFEGRFNIGVFSLHLPMIYAQAKKEGKDFYENLDYYLEMIRSMHKRTYEALSHMKASKNPIGFCYGGFLGGNLKASDNIKPVLKHSTASFGITALNELEQLHHQKSLHEDGSFALEVMKYINGKIDEFKKADKILYAIYGTPAEKLCGTQVKQFREKFGVIRNVSDREYVSNSFHDHVTENISPIEKQNDEYRFWNYFNGGKIQYCKYPVGYNITAMRALIRRAMEMGFYEGVNMSLSYCDDCGYEELEIGIRCPKCGSVHITQIDRMNGYLSFTRVGKDAEIEIDKDGNEIVKIHTRFSPAKNIEIQDRVSM